jgi:hypothetical protein
MLLLLAAGWEEAVEEWLVAAVEERLGRVPVEKEAAPSTWWSLLLLSTNQDADCGSGSSSGGGGGHSSNADGSSGEDT